MKTHLRNSKRKCQEWFTKFLKNLYFELKKKELLKTFELEN